MNNWIGMGRLTRDPSVKTTQAGQTFCNFSIAVRRSMKKDGQPDADFVDCVAFGKTAEFVGKYFKKGNRILVRGRLQNDKYTNKEGNQVSSSKIAVEEVDFVESRASAEQTTTTASAQPAPAPAEQKQDEFMYIPEGTPEELPFS